MANNRRPQAPKRRNFVAKNMNKFNRPQTHRDRSKYDRYEDYLKDQLDDYVNNEWDDLDEEYESKRKAEFLAKLKGEKNDPDCRSDYVEWLDTLSKARLEEMMNDMYENLSKDVADEIDKQVLQDLRERIEEKEDEEYFGDYDY